MIRSLIFCVLLAIVLCADSDYYTISTKATHPPTTTTTKHTTRKPTRAPKPKYSDKVASNTCMRLGEERRSPNGCFKLFMQTDGNLVVYRVSDNFVVWHAGTHNEGGSKACMQDDGNFVIYTPSNDVLWSPYTQGNPGSYARVQNDGNFVIYKPHGGHSWASMMFASCR